MSNKIENYVSFCRIYGPNTEIEWNKEGSRRFLIIDRKPSQTALSCVADSSRDLGEQLNKNLPFPINTSRDTLPTSQNDVTSNSQTNIVTDDPNNVNTTYFYSFNFQKKKKLTLIFIFFFLGKILFFFLVRNITD